MSKYDNLYNTSTLSTHFLQRELNNFVTKVKPIKKDGKYSASATLASIDYLPFKHMVKFLYDTSRSKLVTKMTKNPRYGSLTPLFLLAYKEEYGIKYEEWDKTDNKLKYFLGKYLEGLTAFTTSRKVDEFASKYPNTQSIVKYRALGLTVRTTGIMLALDNYKMNILLHWDKEHGKETMLAKCASFMLLQTWLAHDSIRIPDVMILDPWNWDVVPESHDLTLDFTIQEDSSIDTTVCEEEEYDF